MTTPDPHALRRSHYKLTIDSYSTNDAMVTATMTGPGGIGKFMGDPKVLEQLEAALSPAPVVESVVALVKWIAGAMEAVGKVDEAATTNKIAAYLAGDLADPIGETTEPLLCQHEDDVRACGATGAREHAQCGKRWCVRHWYSEDHTCMAGRKRAAPPPIVAIPAESPEPSYR